jgi:hypothetical protein
MNVEAVEKPAAIMRKFPGNKEFQSGNQYPARHGRELNN